MRRLVTVLFLLLLLAATAACSPADAPAIAIGDGLRGRVIVIDPGHGGVDHGAISKTGTKEDGLNLQVALLVRDKLTQAGATVVLTRDTAEVDYSGTQDTRKHRDMENRAELIRGSQASAIISIHMNKYPNRSYYGPQTFFYKGNSEGQRLANCVETQLLDNLPHYKRFRIVEGNYFILHVTDTPSALIECGFLSNAADEKRLQDPAHQQKIAECIFRGLCDYFGVGYQ